MLLRRTLKFLHEVGGAGLMGAASAQLVISYIAEGRPLDEYAAMRIAILRISEWVLLPSLLVVLVSGLFAMAAHPPYQRAGWAWIKTATTILLLEGTLVAVQGPAQRAAAIATEMAAGDMTQAGDLAGYLRHERGGLYVLLFLSVANIALAVWRPKFRKRAVEAKKAKKARKAEMDETAEPPTEAAEASGEEEPAASEAVS